MNATSLPQILDAIEQIRKIDRMISLSKTSDDAVNKFMTGQYQRLKKEFVKRLLADLMQSNISYVELEPFFENATSYIKKHEAGETVPRELKSNLAEVEKMLRA